MQGLHLTGDLFDCGCSADFLVDLAALSTRCRNATIDAGLTIVDEKYHVFPDWQGKPGGITGTILLAESHLAIHTWPERHQATLDVYVCNVTGDNSRKAEKLYQLLIDALEPADVTTRRIWRGKDLPVALPAAA
jgi:spermidine synthase